MRDKLTLNEDDMRWYLDTGTDAVLIPRELTIKRIGAEWTLSVRQKVQLGSGHIMIEGVFCYPYNHMKPITLVIRAAQTLKELDEIEVGLRDFIDATDFWFWDELATRRAHLKLGGRCINAYGNLSNSKDR